MTRRIMIRKQTMITNNDFVIPSLLLAVFNVEEEGDWSVE